MSTARWGRDHLMDRRVRAETMRKFEERHGTCVEWIAAQRRIFAVRGMKESAGLLLYRKQRGALQVLLGHMGGPFYRQRNAGAWTIPKGGPEKGESLLDTAFREFEEEVGVRPEGEPWPLTPIMQLNGKRVHAWAMESEFDVRLLRSNLHTAEWPPRSGRTQEFPELDRIAWFTIKEACEIAIPGQDGLFKELEQRAR